MRLLASLLIAAVQWSLCVSQLEYCSANTPGNPNGALLLISDDGPLNVYLDPPQPICIACRFTADDGINTIISPDAEYSVDDGNSVEQLTNATEGITIFPNATFFVEDPGTVFNEGDNFRCSYTSDGGDTQTHSGGIVALIFDPPDLDPSGTVDITEGDNLTLSCSAPDNSNTANFQWFNDSSGEAVTAADDTTPPVVYTITDIQREASGDYSCVLTDDDFPNTTPTSTVTVNVQYPPLILSINSPDPVIPRGTSVTITCEYDGNPGPMVSWVRGMDPLNNAFDNVTITTTSTMSTLVVSNIQTSDEGDYRCITNNSIGAGDIPGGDGAYGSDTVTVTVQVEPDPVSSLNISMVTTTSFRVQWTYPSDSNNGGAALTGATLTYTATGNYATAFTDTRDFTTSTTSFDATNLEPLTTYTVSIVVSNSVSEDVGSSSAVEMDTQTLPDPPPSPTLNEIVADSSTELTVSWTGNINSFLQTDLETYRVRYYRTSDSQSVEYVFVQHPTQTVTLTNLDKGTNYTVTVSVNNTAGLSPESNSLIRRTAVDPPTMPTSLTLYPYPDSICFEWSEPTSNGGQDIIQYQLQISEGAMLVNSRNVSFAETRETFGSLTSGTSYTVMVAAANVEGGRGDFASQNDMTTSDFTEDSNFTLNVLKREPFNLTIEWTVSSSDVEYRVQYKEEVDEWMPTDFDAILDGSTTMYKIDGLEPETAYDVRVIRFESDSCVQRSSVPLQAATPEIILTVGSDDDDLSDVSAGDSIVLTCNLTTGGRAPESEVEWSYNGGSRLPDAATVDGSRLILSGLSTNNSGNYTCTVRNATFSFSLSVAPTEAPNTEVLPLWAVIVIAVGAALCVVIFIVVLIVICCCICKKDNKKSVQFDLNRRSKGDVWVDEGGGAFAPTNPGYRSSIDAVDNPYESTTRPRTLTNQDTTTTSFDRNGSREVLTEKKDGGAEYVPITSSTFQSTKQHTDV